MKNPKTTTLGILTIVGALVGGVVAFLNGHLDSAAITAAMAGITAGLGLIHGVDDSNPAVK